MTGIIEVHALSKQYRIGGARAASLREAIAGTASSLFGGAQRRRDIPGRSQLIWALRGVSFSVGEGEIIGVVGHNGAGKSTLLKILSRITDPTEGEVILRGRLASLLEVGTGFHQDLSGRENVFMNGAILGMTRREIVQKLDDIVAFAEVERFLDTPVKHYSSGMYMRLAFAVAAHLEPEILVVDEVLAVGDLAFQQKCLGKLQSVAGTGRTVIFVSHNMGAVSRLCTRGILLQAGEIAFQGAVDELCRRYSGSGQQASTHWTRLREADHPPAPRIVEVMLCDSSGRHLSAPTTSDEIGIQVTYEIPQPLPGCVLAVAILDQTMTPLFATSPFENDQTLDDGPGVFSWRVFLPKAILMEQSYYVTVALYRPWQPLETLPAVLQFSVAGDAASNSALPGGKVGALNLHCRWEELRAGAETR